MVDGQVQCPYHGWEYNKGGECTKMPSTAFCGGVRVTALPSSEKDGAQSYVRHVSDESKRYSCEHSP